MIIISQIFFVLFVITLLVMFIGYWTYADYYTNIKKEYLNVYWGTTTGILISLLYVFFMVWGFKGLSIAVTTSTVVVGLGFMVCLSCVVLYKISILFKKSRQYFGTKRNKI